MIQSGPDRLEVFIHVERFGPIGTELFHFSREGDQDWAGENVTTRLTDRGYPLDLAIFSGRAPSSESSMAQPMVLPQEMVSNPSSLQR